MNTARTQVVWKQLQDVASAKSSHKFMDKKCENAVEGPHHGPFRKTLPNEHGFPDKKTAYNSRHRKHCDQSKGPRFIAQKTEPTTALLWTECPEKRHTQLQDDVATAR